MNVTMPIQGPEARQQSGTIVPVILSGGSGSRLWPVSRESFPKQLWPLVSEWTMLQETARRGVGPQFGAPVVVVNQEHRFLVAEQMRACGIDNATIMLEPVGRNSAPAITAAAVMIAETDPDAVLWMMAADAVIEQTDALMTALDQAVVAARAGRIVTFGMKPHRPETAYGLHRSRRRATRCAGRVRGGEVSREAERGDGRGTDGIGQAPVELGHVRLHGGHVAERDGAVCARRGDGRPTGGRGQDTRPRFLPWLDPASFAASPDISIDYAIAERTTKAAVIPADLGWSDVGSWDALWERLPKDERGNAAVGDVLLEGANNCLARSDGILTAVVGLDDAIVVVTKDAVLAMHKDRAQDVKRVVERLRKAKRPEAIAHNRMYRPWGFYERLILGDRFQVKRIVVTPGHVLSLQKHFHRAEHWVVVSGAAMVTRDGEEIFVRENESIYLPLGCTHRMMNPGKIPLEIIEVQSGSYLGEDDIVRIEDTYGRA